MRGEGCFDFEIVHLKKTLDASHVDIPPDADLDFRSFFAAGTASAFDDIEAQKLPRGGYLECQCPPRVIVASSLPNPLSPLHSTRATAVA